MAGQTQDELAARIRINRPQLARYLGGRIPDPEILVRIARALGVTVDYLLTGRSEREESHEAPSSRPFEQPGLDREARESLKVCAELLSGADRDVRRHLIGQIRLIARMMKATQPQTGTEHPAMRGVGAGEHRPRMVPVLSLVAAGRWRPMQDPYPVGQGFDEVETDLPGRYVYALKIEGDSMEPAYRDGEIIFVDPEQQADDQRALVIAKRLADEGVVFKQLVIMPDGRRVLHSLNPAYPDVEMQDGCELRGRVVFPKRRLKH